VAKERVGRTLSTDGAAERISERKRGWRTLGEQATISLLERKKGPLTRITERSVGAQISISFAWTSFFFDLKNPLKPHGSNP
jgi:hypothetical protein